MVCVGVCVRERECVCVFVYGCVCVGVYVVCGGVCGCVWGCMWGCRCALRGMLVCRSISLVFYRNLCRSGPIVAGG